MASLYRHPENRIFYLAWYDPASGRRRRRSLKTRDVREAAERARRLEAEIEGGTQSVSATLDDIRAAYRRHCYLHKRERTAEADASRLERFFRATGLASLGAATPAAIEAYQSARASEVSVATAARDMQTVRAFFRWATDQGYIPRDICQRVKKLAPRGRPAVDFLSMEDLEGLLAAAAAPVPLRGPGGKGRGRTRPRRTPLAPMIGLAVYAGLRLGEILHLRWEDLELAGERPRLTVAVTDGFLPKDAESRVVPLHARLQALLLAHRTGVRVPNGYLFATASGEPLDRTNALRELKSAARRAGLKCHWYTLRHTFASQLVMAGVSIYKVSKFLGHASVTTTERHYAHLAPELLHEDINRLGAVVAGRSA